MLAAAVKNSSVIDLSVVLLILLQQCKSSNNTIIVNRSVAVTGHNGALWIDLDPTQSSTKRFI